MRVASVVTLNTNLAFSEKPSPPSKKPWHKSKSLWRGGMAHRYAFIDLNVSGRGIPLYTTPPQRKPQEFVCSTGLCHYRKPLTNDRAHQILLDMAKHIETFGDENITEQALSAECIRFILERVTAYGIKEEV